MRKVLKTGDSRCKGPGSLLCLPSLRNIQEDSAAVAARARVRGVRDELREEAGQINRALETGWLFL